MRGFVFRRAIWSAAVLAVTFQVFACSGPTPPPAPAATATPPAPSAGKIRAELAKDWDETKDYLVKLADAMPEQKFGYKSTPAQRSFGEQIMHVAEANRDMLKRLGKATAPAFTAQSAKTKADMLKALSDSFDYGTAVLAEQTDATINETVDADFLGPATRLRV